MATHLSTLDPSTLKTFENAAAGHDGVLSDDSGELIIKPCKQAEIDFYQETIISHPDFADLMPVFMGTLSLGAPALAPDPNGISNVSTPAQLELTQQEKDQKRLHGVKIATETAVVLENLAHGFKHPNVLDIKLGSRLYEDGTPAEKAARLDKVSAETTSGSLNFRIAGMKVWDGKQYTTYDKFYGRQFTAETVKSGFTTFFAPLIEGVNNAKDAMVFIETVADQVAEVIDILETTESRMYGVSVLIVYEGDEDVLRQLIRGMREPKMPHAQEPVSPVDEAHENEEEEKGQDDDDDGDDEILEPAALKVKLIDFAHSAWMPGHGVDENVVKGLKNVKSQLEDLLNCFT